MPKCSKCGKSFKNIQSLNDHFKTVHPSERFVPPKSTTTRNLTVSLVIVIIVVGSLVGYLIFTQQQQVSPTTTQTGVLGQVVSPSVYRSLSGVSGTTLSSIGMGQGVTPPKLVSGPPLTANGKPEVLYIGADYCPYCAAERWGLIVALSKFGTFSNLVYMASSSTDVYANTPTFSFYGSTYSSQYISFVSVEEEDRSQNGLQPPTQDQANLMKQYDPSGSIPFVDIGNQYVVVGAQFLPSTLSGLNWTQISSQLDNPNSAVAKAIDGTANTLISAICKIDGGNPSSVCGQSYAKLSFDLLPTTLLAHSSGLMLGTPTTGLRITIAESRY